MTATAETVLAAGELLPLGEAALLVGLHPAALFAAAVAGEVELQRVGRRWFVERWQLESLRARDGRQP